MRSGNTCDNQLTVVDVVLVVVVLKVVVDVVVEGGTVVVVFVDAEVVVDETETWSKTLT